MTTKITTDWHIGVKRGAGTTPASQEALRQHLRAELQAHLDDQDHLICGDLLNDFTVDASELLATYEIFSGWLTKFGRRLAIVRGNHDFAPRGSALSSFDLLATVLETQFPDLVTVARAPTEWKQFVLIPHLPNNEILNLEVDKLSGVSGKIVVFHANVDNPFAAESQHSLNLSLDQVEGIIKQGNQVICGHEHQYRSLFGGKCLILGNSAPSSVADCLGNGTKLFATAEGLNVELHPILRIEDVFVDVNWRDVPFRCDLGDKLFIRVSGDATAEEAADMVGIIAKLRQLSQAYVVSNSVRVEGMAQMEGLAEMTLEGISKFNVLEALLEELDEREQKVIKEVMA